MDEEEARKRLSQFPEESNLTLSYFNPHGQVIERIVIFEGFDLNKEPKLHFKDTKVYLKMHPPFGIGYAPIQYASIINFGFETALNSDETISLFEKMLKEQSKDNV
jgi:hypothetical protein